MDSKRGNALWVRKTRAGTDAPQQASSFPLESSSLSRLAPERKQKEDRLLMVDGIVRRHTRPKEDETKQWAYGNLHVRRYRGSGRSSGS